MSDTAGPSVAYTCACGEGFTVTYGRTACPRCNTVLEFGPGTSRGYAYIGASLPAGVTLGRTVTFPDDAPREVAADVLGQDIADLLYDADPADYMDVAGIDCVIREADDG